MCCCVRDQTNWTKNKLIELITFSSKLKCHGILQKFKGKFMQGSNDYCPSTDDALKLFSFNDNNVLYW